MKQRNNVLYSEYHNVSVDCSPESTVQSRTPADNTPLDRATLWVQRLTDQTRRKTVDDENVPTCNCPIREDWMRSERGASRTDGRTEGCRPGPTTGRSLPATVSLPPSLPRPSSNAVRIDYFDERTAEVGSWRWACWTAVKVDDGSTDGLTGGETCREFIDDSD